MYKKQNKQDWEKYLDNIRKNFRLQHKSGEYYETDLLVELESIFKEQLTKAQEEGRREGVESTKFMLLGLYYKVIEEIYGKEVADTVQRQVSDVHKNSKEYLKSSEDKK